MNLTQLLGINLANVAQVILVGTPEETMFLTSDDEPYYAVKLKNPITVRCSVDPLILPFETDEVYVRQSALKAEGWKFVDETKPEEGYYQPDWVVDYSKGQQLAVYQSESIKKWAKGNRGERTLDTRNKINEGIRAQIEARIKAKKN